MSIAASRSLRPETRALRHRILVCLDGSSLSEVGLPYAIAMAKTFSSDLTLLYVMVPSQEHARPQTTDAIGWEISRQEAHAYLERIEHATSLALGRPIETRLEQGRAAERIVDVARAIDADLTILGGHGEAGITAWNLGSTVQQVLTVTRGSIFVAQASSAGGVSVVPKRILLPLDGSRRAESVLPTATRLASAYGAEVVLVHVIHEPAASGVQRVGEELELAVNLAAQLEASAKVYLEVVRARLAREVPSLRSLVVRHANERQCLLEISRREHIDLVVLSAHGIGCDPARSFGSVTAHLLAHSVIPLLVLQDLEREATAVSEPPEHLAPPLRASFAPEAV